MQTFYNKRVGSFYEHPDLEIRFSAIQGKGVFTKKLIKSGSTIMIWEGELFTPAEVKMGIAKPNSICGYDENIYIGQCQFEVDTNDQYLNHSCEPNMWMQDEITLIAKRDIHKDEEVTADYAIWEIDPTWKLPSTCNCGSKNCRKIITGMDWNIEYVMSAYKNHLLPCLNRRINTMSAKNEYLLNR